MEANACIHKNAVSNIEQVLEATPHKAAAIRPLTTITKTIKVRRTRHSGHCWRSRVELICDVFLWTPSLGREKAGWPARTYIQQLCEYMWCSPEDLPEAMNDWEEWRDRVRDIRADGTPRWWWWWIYFNTLFFIKMPSHKFNPTNTELELVLKKGFQNIIARILDKSSYNLWNHWRDTIN